MPGLGLALLISHVFVCLSHLLIYLSVSSVVSNQLSSYLCIHLSIIYLSPIYQLSLRHLSMYLCLLHLTLSLPRPGVTFSVE